MAARTRFFVAGLSLLFLTVGCSDQARVGDGQQGAGSGVVWGQDDRRDVPVSPSDKQLAIQAAATLSLIRAERVDHYTKTSVVFKSRTLNGAGEYCPEVPFAKQQDVSHCSAVLVLANRVITAGHCVKTEADCKDQLFVFGRRDPKGRASLKSDVYKCKRLMARKYERGSFTVPDISVIELDRDVTGVLPLTIVDTPFSVSQEIRLIGHSQGLSLKMSEGRILSRINDLYSRTDLDAFHGDSGAPVFAKETGYLTGILIGGAADFVEDMKRGCLKTNVCDDRLCLGERVLHLGTAARSF